MIDGDSVSLFVSSFDMITSTKYLAAIDILIEESTNNFEKCFLKKLKKVIATNAGKQRSKCRRSKEACLLYHSAIVAHEFFYLIRSDFVSASFLFPDLGDTWPSESITRSLCGFYLHLSETKCVDAAFWDERITKETLKARIHNAIIHRRIDLDHCTTKRQAERLTVKDCEDWFHRTRVCYANFAKAAKFLTRNDKDKRDIIANKFISNLREKFVNEEGDDTKKNY